jgi:hypothetical protein
MCCERAVDNDGDCVDWSPWQETVQTMNSFHHQTPKPTYIKEEQKS